MSPCCDAGLDPTQPVQGLLLLGTGFAISAGHCGGMCGPLLAAFGISRRGGERSRLHVLRDVLVYHAGRVLAYAVLGAIVGAGAMATRRLVAGVDLRPFLAVAVGLSLLIPAIGLLLGASSGGPITAPVRALLARASDLAAPLRRLGPLGLGTANGFLPCGPVALVALGAASARDPWHGALSMAAFGAGTLPLLVAGTFAAASLRFRPRPALVRAGSVLLLALGAQVSLRGLAALGVLPHVAVGEWPLW